MIPNEAPPCLCTSKQQGFTYVLVLAAVLVVGVLAGKAARLTTVVMQAEREEELIFRGQAYQRAIRSFYESRDGFQRYPQSLEDLTRDPRFIHRRHLRALYEDPLGGDWLVIPAPDGGIMGVASSSEASPRKAANFPAGLEMFEEAESYQDWTFVFTPMLPAAVFNLDQVLSAE